MIRTLSPDDFVRESSQALEKANHVIATVRISKVYLVFCAIMSFLSSALLMYSMWKLARHGVSSIKVDPVEEFMSLLFAEESWWRFSGLYAYCPCSSSCV